MVMKVNKPTYERVDQLLSYDPETGLLSWRVSRGTRKAGSVAGSTQRSGRTLYIKVKLDGATYLAHRLAWLLYYGEHPVNYIDHIDGDGLNNRVVNLRDVTQSDNQRNARMRSDNSSGVSGIYWDKSRGKWRCYVNVDGRQLHLGCFDSVEEATDIRFEAKNKYGYTDRHGRVS